MIITYNITHSNNSEKEDIRLTPTPRNSLAISLRRLLSTAMLTGPIFDSPKSASLIWPVEVISILQRKGEEKCHKTPTLKLRLTEKCHIIIMINALLELNCPITAKLGTLSTLNFQNQKHKRTHLAGFRSACMMP